MVDLLVFNGSVVDSEVIHANPFLKADGGENVSTNCDSFPWELSLAAENGPHKLEASSKMQHPTTDTWLVQENENPGSTVSV